MAFEGSWMAAPYRGDLMATHPNSIQAQEAIDTDPGTATTLHP
jgi:hypothetical protein